MDLTTNTTPRSKTHWSDNPYLNSFFKRWISYNKNDVLCVTVSPPMATYDQLTKITNQIYEAYMPYETIWVVEAAPKTMRTHFHGMIKIKRGYCGKINLQEHLINKLKQVTFVDAKPAHSINAWIQYITKDLKRNTKVDQYIHKHIVCLTFKGSVVNGSLLLHNYDSDEDTGYDNDMINVDAVLADTENNF